MAQKLMFIGNVLCKSFARKNYFTTFLC